LIQAVIDLQDKIQREGTLFGREFDSRARQEEKRALLQLDTIGQTPRPAGLPIVTNTSL
jgi:hypothetical protein